MFCWFKVSEPSSAECVCLSFKVSTHYNSIMSSRCSCNCTRETPSWQFGVYRGDGSKRCECTSCGHSHCHVRVALQQQYCWQCWQCFKCEGDKDSNENSKDHHEELERKTNQKGHKDENSKHHQEEPVRKKRRRGD